MADLEVVVFDVGGVLLDWNPRHLYRRLFRDDSQAMEEFLATICTQEWNAEQDRGRAWDEAVAELIERFPGHAELIAAYDSRWEEMIPNAISGAPDVLAELKNADVPCYGLTNFSAEKFTVARRNFPFLDWLDGVVISGDEGIVKPDPRIYKLLAERFGLQPGRTLFTDDTSANVVAAEQAGFYSHRFKDVADLRAALVRFGLLN